MRTALPSSREAHTQPSRLATVCPNGVQLICPHLRKGVGSFITASIGEPLHSSSRSSALETVSPHPTATAKVHRKIEKLPFAMTETLPPILMPCIGTEYSLAKRLRPNP